MFHHPTGQKKRKPDANSHPVSFGDACERTTLLGRSSTAAALGLSTLRPVLFLDADEAESAAMLTENPGALDGLIESTQQLLKAFAFSNLNTHKL